MNPISRLGGTDAAWTASSAQEDRSQVSTTQDDTTSKFRLLHQLPRDLRSLVFRMLIPYDLLAVSETDRTMHAACQTAFKEEIQQKLSNLIEYLNRKLGDALMAAGHAPLTIPENVINLIKNATSIAEVVETLNSFIHTVVDHLSNLEEETICTTILEEGEISPAFRKFFDLVTYYISLKGRGHPRSFRQCFSRLYFVGGPALVRRGITIALQHLSDEEKRSYETPEEYWAQIAAIAAWNIGSCLMAEIGAKLAYIWKNEDISILETIDLSKWCIPNPQEVIPPKSEIIAESFRKSHEILMQIPDEEIRAHHKRDLLMLEKAVYAAGGMLREDDCNLSDIDSAEFVSRTYSYGLELFESRMPQEEKSRFLEVSLSSFAPPCNEEPLSKSEWTHYLDLLKELTPGHHAERHLFSASRKYELISSSKLKSKVFEELRALYSRLSK